MKKVIIVTPHPDDETLGCGGTIMRHIKNGDEVHWLIITKMGKQFSEDKKSVRAKEIKDVSTLYGFSSVIQLDFEAAQLDSLPLSRIVSEIGEVFSRLEPNIVYIPYPGDIHSDHEIVFNAATSCSKWFRYPSIEKLLIYETLSETDFTINPDHNGFRPNVFINIEPYLEKKIDILKLYKSEVHSFPFPRSEKAIRSLAYVRGAAGGYGAAEAFMLLKERLG